jgi:hypothetical protein
MDYANLVMVHECGSKIEANLAKGKLLVREEDAADAREVLDAPSAR